MAEIILPLDAEANSMDIQDKSHGVSVSDVDIPLGLPEGFDVSQMKSIDIALDNGPPFTISVNWPADGRWHIMTPEAANQTGITSYRVYGITHLPIKYQIVCLTTNKDYKYTFKDSNGGKYQVTPSDISTLQGAILRSSTLYPITSVEGA